MTDIKLTNIVKRYDNGFVAVKGINLAVKDKEFMVLVGPSGCGKTTCLRMIAGLEEVTEGDLFIGTRRVNDVQPKDRDIAMVFQSYALYPHMTVYENMAFGLKLAKVPRVEIDARVQEAARMLKIVDKLENRPKELSGGLRQRVALGRAIVRKPSVFLFDEPLSNLDAKLRADMRYELKTLQQRLQTTMVYVTHDQIEAMTLGDRITVMSQGDIQQVAVPTVIYEKPFNRFVAAFIGSPGMNFLPGRIEREGEGWTFQIGGGARVALGMAERHAFAAHAGKETVLGVRPEQMHHASYVQPLPASTRIEATVRVVELMGDHQYVYLQFDGVEKPAIMKSPAGHRCASGERIGVQIDSAPAHVFGGTDDHAVTLTLPVGFAQVQ